MPLTSKKSITESVYLVSDVGGTNARFALVDPTTGALQHIGYRKTADFPTVTAAIQDYLKGEAEGAKPTDACIAVACPAEQDEIRFTNNQWRFSQLALKTELGLKSLRIINDFAALARAVPYLKEDDIRPIGNVLDGAKDAAIAVLGPGTGLGVSGLVPNGLGGWSAVSGEGGHVSLAPESDIEIEILRRAWKSFGRTSAERILCGSGLAFLYHTLAEIHGQPAETISEVEVTSRALSGNDALARETIHQFCALLGSFAGDLALTLGARGGVFIGGGIVPRFGSLLESSPFRERFEYKGRFNGYNAAIPTFLMVPDENPALLGVASIFTQNPILQK